MSVVLSRGDAKPKAPAAAAPSPPKPVEDTIAPTGRLIVKNLSKNIDETQLMSAFKKHGEVTDCRIMRDKVTGESRRFGFIGFRDVDSAVSAQKYFSNAYIGTGRVSVAHAAKIGEYIDPKKQKILLQQQREAERLLKKQKAAAPAVTPTPAAGDEKLSEFVEAMTHKKGRKVWADEAVALPANAGVAMRPNDVSDTEDIIIESTTVAHDKSVDDMAYLKQHITQGWSSDEDEEDEPATREGQDIHMDESDGTSVGDSVADPLRFEDADPTTAEVSLDEDSILDHGRVRVVNLPYTTTSEALSAFFGSFGPVREAHICKDDSTNKARGFGFVSFAFPEHAVRCLTETENGVFFEGRIVKVQEAKSRSREFHAKLEVNKATINKSFKAKREAEKRAGAHKQQQTWNLLYVSSNTAVTALADILGLKKDEVMDINASDLAVRAAIAETEVVKRTVEWLKTEGIRVNAFERKGDKVGSVSEEPADDVAVGRSKSTIIAKHLPLNFDEDELRSMFSKNGILAKFLVSPTKTVAIIQFCEEANAIKAFKTLAFRRLKSVPLYLEWAPEDIFISKPNREGPAPEETASGPVHQLSTSSSDDKEVGAAPLEAHDASTEAPVATLFVKNVSFSTTQSGLTAAFAKTKGFVKATVSMKLAPSGEKLSNGFGFVDYRTADAAIDALKKMQGFELDSKKLELSMAAGRKGEDRSGSKVVALMDSAELIKRAGSRLSVKNIAFQATKEDLRKLFSTYGNVASVRLPQKVGERQHRGFAFVEFMSKDDALRAYESLQHTHLYGRRLIIEPAELESVSVDAVQQQAEKRKLVAEGGITTESKRRKLRKDL